MSGGYLAVGHGLEVGHGGAFDPGAVAPGGTTEHALATKVCAAASARLAAAGVAFVSEVPAAARNTDPDYMGSAARANAAGAAWALEVHFDWSGGRSAGVGLYVSAAGQDWARHISFAYTAHSLVTLPPEARPDLYFLQATHMPALIWEAWKVADWLSDAALADMGAAVADGTMAWLGVVPPHPQLIQEDDDMQGFVALLAGGVSQWLVWPDGSKSPIATGDDSAHLLQHLGQGSPVVLSQGTLDHIPNR
jgi:hypothetical protein